MDVDIKGTISEGCEPHRHFPEKTASSSNKGAGQSVYPASGLCGQASHKFSGRPIELTLQWGALESRRIKFSKKTEFSHAGKPTYPRQRLARAGILPVDDPAPAVCRCLEDPWNEVAG